jgi:uncharacterized protein
MTSPAAAPRALILSGGWEGHEPKVSTARYSESLNSLGYTVEVIQDPALLAQINLLEFDLVIPNWTMGEIPKEAAEKLAAAVESGVGLAGIHGGMGDSFRGNITYQWMVGGQFLGHPHVGKFTVCRTGIEHPIVSDWPDSFEYDSEQYYMMVDPGVTILADTIYRNQGYSCRMPVAWIKQWGRGKIYYCSLGHLPSVEFDQYPLVYQSYIKGFTWATRSQTQA